MEEQKDTIRLYFADDTNDNKLYEYFKSRPGYEVVGENVNGMQVVEDVKQLRTKFLIS